MDFDFPLELPIRGNPTMLEAVVWSVAHRMRVRTRIDSQAPRTSSFKQVVLLGASGVPAGTLRLQALPDNRCLLTLALPPNTVGGLTKQFRSFCESLLSELARLGFIEMPDVPNDPLGFLRAQ